MAVNGSDRDCPAPCRRSSGICNDKFPERDIQSVNHTEILRAKSKSEGLVGFRGISGTACRVDEIVSASEIHGSRCDY